MLRRRFACLLTLALFGVFTAAAVASPEDVINDVKDNGAIDSCHSRADYDTAQKSLEPVAYGEELETIDAAMANPALVGTAERPCPSAAPESDDSGIGAAALIGIPAAVLLLVGAILAARRRRDDDDAAPE